VKIINRYILKEHVGPFVFALSAATSLLLLQYIARRFGDLVGKGLSWQVIAEFFLLSIPFTVAMTIPMAVLVAVLHAFSRLASENEVTALKAGGVSTRALMLPILAVAVVLSMGMLGFNDQLLPRANHELAVLQLDILRKKPTFALRPQVINTIREGALYLRATRIDEATQHLHDVVIYDLGDPMRRRTIYGDSGILMLAANQRDLTMRLFKGVMLSVPTQQPVQLSRVYYDENLLKVRDVANEFKQTNADTAMKGEREMSICEMQKEYLIARADFRRYEAERDSFKLLETQAPQPGTPSPAATRLAMPQESPGTAAAQPRPEKSRGLAELYCRMLEKLPAAAKLVKAKELHAAEVPPPPQAGARQRSYPPSAGMTIGSTSLADADMRVRDAQRRQNRMGVEIQKKFSLAFACIVFVLVGAPIALRFSRGGVGLVIGVSFLVFATYYVALIGGEELANHGYLSPFWAMWGANVIFVAAGLALISRMGYESATSRGGGFASMVDATRLWFARRGRRAGTLDGRSDQ
jgi:lipopolysaccharide export system permease protein